MFLINRFKTCLIFTWKSNDLSCNYPEEEHIESCCRSVFKVGFYGVLVGICHFVKLCWKELGGAYDLRIVHYELFVVQLGLWQCKMLSCFWKSFRIVIFWAAMLLCLWNVDIMTMTWRRVRGNKWRNGVCILSLYWKRVLALVLISSDECRHKMFLLGHMICYATKVRNLIGWCWNNEMFPKMQLMLYCKICSIFSRWTNLVWDGIIARPWWLLLLRFWSDWGECIMRILEEKIKGNKGGGWWDEVVMCNKEGRMRRIYPHFRGNSLPTYPLLPVW